jgi:hypothetical protein
MGHTARSSGVPWLTLLVQASLTTFSVRRQWDRFNAGMCSTLSRHKEGLTLPTVLLVILYNVCAQYTIIRATFMWATLTSLPAGKNLVKHRAVFKWADVEYTHKQIGVLRMVVFHTDACPRPRWVGAVCAEVLGGVRRICGANNSSSSCRQNLFGGDERVELSARKGAPRSILVGCNYRSRAGGCDGGGELERQKSGNPKLIRRKRRRKETIALGR